MGKNIIIIGSGGLARTALDLAFHAKRKITGIIDLNYNNVNEQINNTDVIGNLDTLEQYKPKDIDLLIAIGDCNIREEIYRTYSELGFAFPNFIHPSAIMSKTNIKIGDGIIIGAGSIIMSDVKIGNNNIIYSGCIIEHECTIGNNCTLAPGVKIAGRVSIQNNVSIGIGCNIIDKVRIDDNVVIGAGSLVITDVVKNAIVFGVPAKPKN